MKILRSKNGTYKIAENLFGKYLAPCPDPEAKDIPEEILNSFQPNQIPKIPSSLWSRWIRLAYRIMPLEVHCDLLYSESRRKWKITIPPQLVSGGGISIETREGSISISDGKQVSWPPHGYRHVGTSHSHHKMQPFFSSTDDASEIGNTGLHVVIGSFKTNDMTNAPTYQYEICASVTTFDKRYTVPSDQFIDITQTDHKFKEQCLINIQRQTHLNLLSQTNKDPFETFLHDDPIWPAQVQQPKPANQGDLALSLIKQLYLQLSNDQLYELIEYIKEDLSNSMSQPISF